MSHDLGIHLQKILISCRWGDYHPRYVWRSPRQDCGSPILPPGQRRLSTPINLQQTFDLKQNFGILLHQIYWEIPFNNRWSIQENSKHATMADESTQGDGHDKAWEKVEKKFTQYVKEVISFLILRSPLLCFPSNICFVVSSPIYDCCRGPRTPLHSMGSPEKSHARQIGRAGFYLSNELNTCTSCLSRWLIYGLANMPVNTTIHAKISRIGVWSVWSGMLMTGNCAMTISSKFQNFMNAESPFDLSSNWCVWLSINFRASTLWSYSASELTVFLEPIVIAKRTGYVQRCESFPLSWLSALSADFVDFDPSRCASNC
jgi:hypothetical protein